MTSVHTVLEALLSCEQRCALATIIHVEGSAYCKEGTIMLFCEDGTKVGMLSAGCLEEEVSFYAAKVIENKTWSVHQFNTKAEDDLSWGMGCNGIVHILIEHIDDEYKALLQTLYAYLKNGISVWMIKSLSLLQTLFICEHGETFGNWEAPFLPLSLHGQWYYQHFMPKPRLFIFGAGEDAKPLVRFAKEVNFFVTVCDWRESLCNTSHFPSADACMIGFPKEIVPRLLLREEDFVVIMTHHFQRDQQLIELLCGQCVRYIGILGPRHRTTRLLEGKTIPKHLHSPVGLTIGAKGPTEIAISIIAEIIQVLRGK
ncbi:XdhC family protein [Bacillus sp. DX1.1]|uniref:XdhC family protein n=1 Tax=unclassified Bacillus (in: firmicutes) TaxID=185979 RepID=UPI00257075B3|nr:MULTISPECIES: XdhC family protein [unclassified Bacillus (in: firmicutes)]MDM5154423.1 XdhC family protein [Bacillus sp. DX1.1]WJE83328.1 XdhC family protein [Bacillus sp. DX3.1]